VPPPIDTQTSAQVLGVLIMAAGLVGVFIPVLPGPVLIWVGALVWASGDGYQRVGWPTLIVLALLMVVAWGSDLLMTSYFTKRNSSSWLTVAGSVAGGILGGLFLSGLPLVGTIFGAVIGGMLGVLVVECLRLRQFRPAMQSSGQYLVGCVLGQMLELLIVLLMIALFLWQARS
jgi:uncharacterized protein YqgC (DUF456 family)